jgi:dihydropteroate synthase
MQSLNIRNKQFDWGSRTYIMGILNVTPDSFSDGGDFITFETAIAQARRLIAAGADILDIGGQSTRPGAETISVEEELKRTIAIIKALRQEFEVPISIDTTRSRIAEAAIEAGADWVNDISGATFDPNMLTTVARLQVPLILMHIKGTPKTMQQLTDYQDLISEITQFFVERITAAEQAGISRSQITIDPGIGFAKTTAQNIQLLQQLSQFKSLNLPILVGVSRKSFIGKILDQSDPKARIWGTAAACVAAIAGGADILRVHDVKEMGEVSRVADAIWR